MTHVTLGIVARRRETSNRWAPVSWAPCAVLPAAPETAPWTRLAAEGAEETWYVGSATLDLHPGETAHYRDNLGSGRPSVWVALRRNGERLEVASLSVDPYEGEALAGDEALILEALPMPAEVEALVAAFVAEFHVEREFYKRKRKPADPNALARRPPRVLGLDRDEEDGR
ncbi:DUF3305 domain-containing protein [Salinarimonas ramus]|uniref:Molybdopterin-guanine dinucleotide biosynthesis protein A n=1 Tax=Salinarimonas ramus TaxID=690164 RepID=A0A917QDE1_9HYPH|nr:DUF3305 domain-containing protein [Salinarimonas ramus]GGK45198.1 hypothetical protein GCM10011322_35460 [Salinarimonas ramus]